MSNLNCHAWASPLTEALTFSICRSVWCHRNEAIWWHLNILRIKPSQKTHENVQPVGQILVNPNSLSTQAIRYRGPLAPPAPVDHKKALERQVPMVMHHRRSPGYATAKELLLVMPNFPYYLLLPKLAKGMKKLWCIWTSAPLQVLSPEVCIFCECAAWSPRWNGCWRQCCHIWTWNFIIVPI